MALIVCYVVLFVSIIRVVTYRQLYADGSWYAMKAITSHEKFILPNRFAVQWLEQIFAGNVFTNHFIDNSRYFILLLGFGYFIVPSLICFLIYSLLKEDKRNLQLHLVAASTAILLFGGMVGESAYTAMLVLLVSALLVNGCTPWSYPTVFVLSVLLIGSYESMIFYGPYLLYVIIKKVMVKEVESKSWLYLSVLALIFSTAYQLYFVIYPDNPSNRSNASDIVSLLNFKSTKVYFLTFVLCIIMTAIFRKRILFVLSVTFFSIFILLDIPMTQVSPKFQYSFRSVGSAIVLFILLYSQLKKPRIGISFNGRRLFCTALILFSLLDISASTGFNAYVAKVQQATSLGGIIPFEKIAATTSENIRFSWAWSMPSLSFVLAQNENSGIVLNQFKPSWEPFDPHKALDHEGLFWFG